MTKSSVVSSTKAPCRVVVLVSGNGSNLQTLIDQCDAGKVAGTIVSVISNRVDAYAIERAKACKIDTAIVAHSDFEERASFEEALIDRIESAKPDLIVLAGFMRILSPNFVNKYLGKMLNIHPSLLPKYRGLNTHQRAIDAKDKEHGVSVHFVTPELDGGPVILQAKVPIFEDDSAQELAQRVVVQEHMIYPLVVNWFCNGRLTLQNGIAQLDNQLLGCEGYAQD